SLDKAKNYLVTEGRHANSDPCFSGDGKYLFFVSGRDFNPMYSSTEWNHAYRDMARIYAVTLSNKTPSPFLVKDKTEKETQTKDKKGAKEKPKANPLEIDAEGIDDPITRLPVKPATYPNLQSVGGIVYYASHNTPSAQQPTLHVFDVAAKKETSLG